MTHEPCAVREYLARQAEDGIRDRSPSRGLGDVYKETAFRLIMLLADQYILVFNIPPTSSCWPIKALAVFAAVVLPDTGFTHASIRGTLS